MVAASQIETLSGSLAHLSAAIGLALFSASCAASEEPRDRVRYEDIREPTGKAEPVGVADENAVIENGALTEMARRPKESRHIQQLAEETVLSAVNGFRETFSLLASTTVNAAESLEQIYTEPTTNHAPQLGPIAETLPSCPKRILAEDADRARPDPESVVRFAENRNGQRAESHVNVLYHVGVDGRVVSPRIESESHPGFFGPIALRTVSEWRHPKGFSCAAARVCFRFELDGEGELQSLPPIHTDGCRSVSG